MRLLPRLRWIRRNAELQYFTLLCDSSHIQRTKNRSFAINGLARLSAFRDLIYIRWLSLPRREQTARLLEFEPENHKLNLWHLSVYRSRIYSLCAVIHLAPNALPSNRCIPWLLDMTMEDYDSDQGATITKMTPKEFHDDNNDNIE